MSTMNIWTEHRNPEGRTYWFNTGTKQSVWEKPDDLKTPFERALSKTKWKEYFSNGRKYYYNTETKESKWEMPEDVLHQVEQIQQEKANELAAPREISAPTQGALVPMGGTDPSSSTSSQLQNGAASGLTPATALMAVGAHTGGLPLAANSILPARPHLPDDPVIPHNGFATLEEGEKAFVHLLKKAGVDANWTWDQTMRAIITDPLYKALNTLAEKKTCWEKYTNGLRAKEQEEKEARLAKLRPAIRNMLKGNPNVFYYTTFRTADKLFAQHPIWQQARIESERRLIFEEYVNELKQREMQESRASRSRSVSKVMALFKELGVDVVTRWRTAHNMVVESDEWRTDEELQKLPTLDILLAFEDYSRVREREYEEQMRRTQVEKTRKERKAREAFKTLLHERVQEGILKARSKWKEVYPTFRDDERYLNMLGNPGSNPLELFWDMVDTLDQKLDAKIVVVEDVLKQWSPPGKEAEKDVTTEADGDVKMAEASAGEKGFVIEVETKEEEFIEVLKVCATVTVSQLSQNDLQEVFEALKSRAIKKQAEAKRKAEKRQRHLQDDLRYAMKKLPEPIDINISYEEVVPLIENLPEYKAVEDEEGRRAAFAKFVKRQKERMREAASEDGASTTSRKRKEPAREHKEDRERDRDRERERERERGERDREREKEREKEREYRDKDRERDRDRDRDRGKDYDRPSRASRHRYDDYDDRRREYGREREERDYKSRHRDEDRKSGRKGSRAEYFGGREWDEEPRRERSASAYREEPKDKRELEGGSVDDRAEKRPRYEREEVPSEPMEVDKRDPSVRAETPEEGEI